MGVPKTKWSTEEEEALRRGVKKYGPGKWRLIQKDANFGAILAARSNVDLKDKWRNLFPSAKGECSLALVDTEEDQPIPASPSEELVEDSGAKPKYGDFSSNDSRFEELVLEAVAALNDRQGSSVASITKFIEGKVEVPPNFRSKVLPACLQVLLSAFKLTKVKGMFKLTVESMSSNKVLDKSTPFTSSCLKAQHHDEQHGTNVEVLGEQEMEKMARTTTTKTKSTNARFNDEYKPGITSDMEEDIVVKHVKKRRKGSTDAPLFLINGKYTTAEEATKEATRAIKEAEIAAQVAEQAANEAEVAEREAREAERLANELLEEAEMQKKAEDESGIYTTCM